MLTSYSYITIPGFTGDIKADVEALLCANNKQKIFDHVKAVADMNVNIAEKYGLDKNICELCGYLHDISAVVTPGDMMAYAMENEWYIDEAESKYPFLFHQRISKVIAEQDFGITDEQILSAIECHTTLKTNPSVYDMALFIADKLAWDGEDEAPFYSVVSDALKQSLESAALTYMDYIVANKMILYPHKWFEACMRFLISNKRFNDYISINNAEAAALFISFDKSLTVRNCKLINGGMCNSNYVVTTDDKKYLLRLYAKPTDVAEIGAYSYLKDMINIPELFYYDGSKKDFPYSYAILDYIEGITLNDAIRADKKFPRYTAYEIGRMCAVIHSKKYAYDALLDQRLNVSEQIPKTHERILQLLNGKAGNNLRRKTRDRLFEFINSHMNIFNKIEDESVLCHGDLNYNNILIDSSRIYLIDFEFAYSGSRYHDIGHFFRRKSENIQLYVDRNIYDAFAEGYNMIAPTPLPDNWLILARLCDIPPMLCLINCDDPPAEWVSDIEYEILCAVKAER